MAERQIKPAGISTIEHKVRFKLGLTIDEYVMADLIYQFNKLHKSTAEKPVVIGAERYFKVIGFTRDEVIATGIKLKEKGIVVSCDIQKRYVTTKKWNDNFDDDVQFDQLWDIHPWGNKAAARTNFLRMKKMIPFDQLVIKLQEYINSTDDPQYLSHLKKWLDPKLKKWEDPIAYNGRINKKQHNVLTEEINSNTSFK